MVTESVESYGIVGSSFGIQREVYIYGVFYLLRIIRINSLSIFSNRFPMPRARSQGSALPTYHLASLRVGFVKRTLSLRSGSG